MLKTLIAKECQTILLGPRFLGAFVMASVLILLSVVVGVQEYRSFERTQGAAAQLLAEEQAQTTSWNELRQRAFRRPDPLQIFASGVHNDVGRLSVVSAWSDATLQQSIFTDDPILAVFRVLDLTFIVLVVLSLYAIVLTYDAVSGEREQGTLQLTFANAVPRSRYLVAKLVGTWLGLAVPLMLPLLVGVLVVVLAGVPFTAGDWARLGILILGGALYFTFFVTLGVAVSACTRRSQTSFLVLLVGWILLVLVVPRAGIMAAVELHPVPSVAEIESRKDGFQRREWELFRQATLTRWGEREAELDAVPEDQRAELEDEKTWGWMEDDERERQEVKIRIAEHSRRISEEIRNLKAGQERLGLNLSRISPAAAFQLIALDVAGTGLELQRRYEVAISDYRERFASYVDDKGGRQMIISRRSSSDDDDGHDGGGGGPFGEGETLDLRDMPRFQAPRVEASAAIAPTIPDLGLLGLLGIGAFAVAFVSFLRYDVRP